MSGVILPAMCGNGESRGGISVATWARSAPGELIITGESIQAQSIPVKPAGGGPGHSLLLGSGWSAYPGATWREDDLAPGVWQCAVFPTRRR